ncbi:RHS repeat-associated core domain-containing protein [Pseudomonas silesiensis]|uniref:RHS repeat-associated core domain-containing protein n=1 Tax=Pseudomonas silesiensis TaxID=1853130 RepID=UPI0009EE5F67|nr:RHS repeat-associated core domain-containing protein [Pseudomonas silesiensis]VVP05144.1 hypothetical protein PS874_02894 [Pseudomonas fluorescens]
MTARREIPLCHYRYDPLDQLISCATSAQANTQRFYLKDRLANEVQGAVQRSIMQHGDQLLAEQRCEGGPLETTILATDQQRSVLTTLDSTRPHTLAYTPYGHRIPENGLLSLLGFSGERPDPVTGCYLLGNGYRAFNPVLMRFNSPESLSPFGEGGLNAYAYCVGDPINRVDPTGHVGEWISKLLGFLNNASGTVAVNQSVSKSRYMKNMTILGDGAFTFDDIFKGKQRLNISAHGIETPFDQPSKMVMNRETWLPSQVYTEMKNQGYDFSSYAEIRLIFCHSANGGQQSFASQFQKLTNINTKGYLGTVVEKHPIDDVMKVFEKGKIKYPDNPQKYLREHYNKEKSYTYKKRYGLIAVNYHSVRFPS